MCTGRWCAEEHLLFLRGLAQHGQNYGEIAALVKSRTMLQCRTHGQKHFQKIARKAQQSAVVKNAVPSDGTPKLGLEDSRETAETLVVDGGGLKVSTLSSIEAAAAVPTSSEEDKAHFPVLLHWMKGAEATQIPSSSASEEDAAAAKPTNILTFPVLLHAVISDKASDDCIHWLPCGTRFIVSDKVKFERDILPRHFGGTRGSSKSSTTKYSFFTRKLLRWNFTRVPNGSQMGAYYCENFKRDEPELAKSVTSQRTVEMAAVAGILKMMSQPLPVVEGSEGGESEASSTSALATARTPAKYSYPPANPIERTCYPYYPSPSNWGVPPPGGLGYPLPPHVQPPHHGYPPCWAVPLAGYYYMHPKQHP